MREKRSDGFLFLLFKKIPFYSLLLTVVVLSSCEYNTEDEVFAGIECKTEEMSYLADIKPVIENNCLTCHSADILDGGVNLEDYNNLKFWVDNGRVQGAISHLPTFIPMPPAGEELSPCNKAKILSWIDEGALNN